MKDTMKDILLVCETKEKAKVEFERMRDQLSIMIKSTNRSKLMVTLKNGIHIYFESSNKGKTAVVGVGMITLEFDTFIQMLKEIMQDMGGDKP